MAPAASSVCCSWSSSSWWSSAGFDRDAGGGPPPVAMWVSRHTRERRRDIVDEFAIGGRRQRGAGRMKSDIDRDRRARHTWALVLAAGEGKRLSPLTTTPSGTPIPKQYCSLWDGPSLLQEALARA